jgi:uncharacterized membrane protein
MAKTSIGLEENWAGVLAYFFGFLSGLIVLLIEKENRFVRFHAMQSLVLFGGYFVLMWVLTSMAFLGLDILWALVSLPLNILLFVLWIILMVKAYNGEEFRLPVIGDFAAKQVNK